MNIKQEKKSFSKDFINGEKSMAKAILRRITKGRSIEHIKLLCELVIKEDK